MNFLITPGFQSSLKLIKAYIYPKPHRVMTLWYEDLAVDHFTTLYLGTGFHAKGRGMKKKTTK